jgi:hypothetical protein
VVRVRQAPSKLGEQVQSMAEEPPISVHPLRIPADGGTPGLCAASDWPR